MYKAVLAVMNSFNSVWSSNTVIAAIVVSLQNYVNVIVGSEQNQKTGTLGATKNKESLAEALINLAITIASAGKAYAVSVNNVLLKQACSITKSDLARAKTIDLIALCKNLYTAVNPYAASLTPFGADAASLTSFNTAITNFDGNSSQPALARAVVKNATINIALQSTNVSQLLDEQLDLLMVQYQSTNADFYNQYTEARVIHDLRRRKKVTVKGYVYINSNQALTGATVELSGNGITKQKITDATAAFKFMRLNTGTYTITVSAAGYVTQSKTLTAGSPQVLVVDFMLAAAGG